jgi:hypothetical protein
MEGGNLTLREFEWNAALEFKPDPSCRGTPLGMT